MFDVIHTHPDHAFQMLSPDSEPTKKKIQKKKFQKKIPKKIPKKNSKKKLAKNSKVSGATYRVVSEPREHQDASEHRPTGTTHKDTQDCCVGGIDGQSDERVGSFGLGLF